MELTTDNHDRDSAGMRYVYPVVSRRAGGLSIGINLNPNKACNWRCVYCQVPGLQRGVGPAIDLELLERELSSLLSDVLEGSFFERSVPPEFRRLNDIAISGDGEPTSSADFGAAVEAIARARSRFAALGSTQTVLITNGSLLHKPAVGSAIQRLAELSGSVWYKLDSATQAGQRATNDQRAGPEVAARNLARCAELCPTWIQTCVFARGGEPPSQRECERYLTFVGDLLASGTKLEGVLLYGLARPSHQPEASELSALPASWLEAFAGRIEALGLTVRVSP